MATLELLLNKIKLESSRILLSRYVPQNALSSDVYLVEFPKSGVTWLSYILANAFLISTGDKRRASFYSVGQYVPDIHVSRKISPVIFPGFPRFIKSHSPFNPNYAQLIYIARHPADVMLSYYKFSRYMYGANAHSLEAFIEHPRFGIVAWKNHINDWFNLDGKNKAYRSAQSLHLIRYEDLVQDAEKQTTHLSKNLGLGLSQDVISQAVELGSKANMSASERLYTDHNPRYDFKFIGGTDASEMTTQLRDQIESSCINELALLGYTRNR